MFPPFDCAADAFPAGDATQMSLPVTIAPFTPPPSHTVCDGALDALLGCLRPSHSNRDVYPNER